MAPASRFIRSLIVAFALVTLLVLPAHAQSPGTAFVYQGQLATNGALANGACDFTFTLFDAPTGGNAIGAPLSRDGVVVTGGLFAVSLDFGAAAFTGAPRWLAIAAKCSDDAAPVALSPRQALSPTPYAIYAASAPWSGVTGKPPLAESGYTIGAGLTLSGVTLAVDPAVMQRRVTGLCGAAQAINAVNQDGTVGCVAIPAAPAESDPLAWHLTGNGVTPGQFVGTTNTTPLEMRVNNTTGFRLLPGGAGGTDTPNLAGGNASNTIAGGVQGGVIAGGANHGITANFAFIGGGSANLASAPFSVVPGGMSAHARLRGQLAHASGGFGAVRGSAQASEYVLRANLNIDNPTELFLDDSGERLTIPLDMAMVATVQLVARTQTGANGARIYNCVLSNENGTTTGFCTQLYSQGSAFAWSVTVSDAQDALVITATGPLGQPTRAVAVVHTAEVMFPDP